MKHVSRSLVLVSSVLLLSCARHKEAKEYDDYAAHYLQAQQDYCSSNILVAEQGLLNFRHWMIDRDQAGKPRFNYDLNRLQVDARLFLLYESRGETNKAEVFYEDGAQAYIKHLQSQRLSEHMLSKHEMRERLARQEKGLDVGWQKSKTGM